MTLPAPFAIREIWYQDIGSTFPSAFVAASDASWVNSGVKLRAYDLKFDDLKHVVVADPSVQASFYGRPAPIPTLRGGIESMAVSFKMHLGGGSGTTTPTALATLLGVVMGGTKSPGAISDAAEAACTTTLVNATAHGQAIGQAVLAGTRGDGYADARVGVISAVGGVDEYTVKMAWPGAPELNAVLKNGHTIFLDYTDESYQDLLLVGYYPGSGVTDDPDIINCMGCSGTVTFGGLAPGETPFAEFTFRVADWRNEPYASTRALATSTAETGNDPVSSRAMGAMTIGDAAASTRTTVAGGAIEINPNMTLVPIEDRNGVNGVGGWVKVPGGSGPTFGLTRYWGDMPGLYDDLVAGTAKQIMLQLGHEAQNCVAFDLQRAFLAECPTRVEYLESMGLKLMFHGDGGGATALSTADLRMQDAPFRVHLL